VSLPKPVPGLVIRYAFLWSHDAERGLAEGKDRPSVVVLATRQAGDQTIVTVAPITHSMPGDPDMGVEIPASTKARLGLDDDRSWVIVNEVNRFVWPAATCGRYGPQGRASRTDCCRLRSTSRSVIECWR
jgi:mRNA-degrading endonuclease toxin of MazEF toxin-antitoxin module